MQTLTTPSKTAYGYENGALIIDALTDGKTLEFANADGRSCKVTYTFFGWQNRSEIRIVNDDNTACGTLSLDPFEWLFGKLKAYGYTLTTNLN